MDRRRVGTVEETPWWLEVNGARAAHGTATPYRLEALAAGRLLVDGYITTATDIQSLTMVHTPPGCVGLRVRVPAEQAADAQRHRAQREQHGCGVRHLLSCDRSLLPARDDWVEPPMDAFADLFRLLFRAAERYGRAGGMHTASLTDGTALLEPIADVGRHNAVDKAIGWAVLEGVDRSTLGLLLTSRVSAAIAMKAARAGLAWIASRSIPTDLAVEIATAARLPIVARAAGNDARVFGVPAPGEAVRDASPEQVYSRPPPHTEPPDTEPPDTEPPSGPPPAGVRGLVAPDDTTGRKSTDPQPLPTEECGSDGAASGERVVREPGDTPVAPDAA